MRKMRNLFVIMIVILFASGIIFTALRSVKINREIKGISEKLIRFHVIANSDSIEDQSVKLVVRDNVLDFISPKLKDASNIDECRDIIEENKDKIEKIASNTLKEEGYDYSVASELAHENFPIKTYGNITLPQGNYEAFRIILGEGSGQNWWCVMFPPLCFVDITKGEASFTENEEKMKTVLTDKEYDLIDNTRIDEEEKSEKKESKIEFKFKIKELIDDVF